MPEITDKDLEFLEDIENVSEEPSIEPHGMTNGVNGDHDVLKAAEAALADNKSGTFKPYGAMSDKFVRIVKTKVHPVRLVVHKQSESASAAMEKKHGRHLHRIRLKVAFALFLLLQIVTAVLSLYIYVLEPTYDGDEDGGQPPTHSTNGQELQERCAWIHGFFLYSIVCLLMGSICCCEVIVIVRIGDLGVRVIDKMFEQEDGTSSQGQTKHVLVRILYRATVVFSLLNMLSIATYEAMYLGGGNEDCWPFIEGTPVLRATIILQLSTGFIRALIILATMIRHVIKELREVEKEEQLSNPFGRGDSAALETPRLFAA